MPPPATKTDIPAPVRRYAERAVPAGSSVPARVRVVQSGLMWLKPGGRSLPFTAVEDFSVETVAFSWLARFRFLPLVSMKVVDRYADGAGSLEARLFGVLPFMRQSGQATAEGAAMRYLAELPWVPHAMLPNPELEWRELDARTVEVGTSVGAAKVAVRLEFDAAGDIVSAFSDGRPHPEGNATVPRPWGGVYSDYQVIDGIRLPTRAEVRWELPEGPFTYWSGEIHSVGVTR